MSTQSIHGWHTLTYLGFSPFTTDKTNEVLQTKEVLESNDILECYNVLETNNVLDCISSIHLNVHVMCVSLS